MERLTTSEVNRRLHTRQLSLVGEYLGSDRKHTFKCLSCNHRWRVFASNVVSKRQICPSCSSRRHGESQRLTESEVAQRLRKASIKLLSSYTGTKDRGEFKCLICSHVWKTIIGNTLQGHGCPRCNVPKPIPMLTQSVVRRRLKKKGLRFLGMYKGDKGLHEIECSLCRFRWKRKGLPSSCPQCKKSGKSYHQYFFKLVKKDLKSRRIALKGEYKSASLQKVSCLKCSHTWKARLILGKVVCPRCHPHKFGTSEEVVRSIVERITGWKFPKARPSEVPWTRGLHLDGYNRRHRAAFEYQGYQHYTWESHFFRGSTRARKLAFLALKRRDERKRIQCMRHSVVLLRVPYWKTPEEVEIMVKNRLKSA